MEDRPIIIPVGGFLGSGKTTLILAAAEVARGRGLRTAAIFNDQGAELVDSKLATVRGLDSDQVTGGCFCCRFPDLIDAAQRLRAYSPEVIFAEAVGSCTDISATTLQPLKLHYSHEFRLAPFSVLVDAHQASMFHASEARQDLSFLFHKQIEEADLICFTKADLHRDFPKLEGAPLRFLSALTGQGVAAWLNEVLAGHIPSGGKILDIDYQRYARAEAALAWLNCRAIVKLDPPLSPALLVGPFHEGLDAELTKAGFEMAHLKIIDNADTGYLKVACIRNGAEPSVDGVLDASPARQHELLLNLRVAGDPEILRHIVEDRLSKLPGEVEVILLQCFRPSAPQPWSRIAEVIGQ